MFPPASDFMKSLYLFSLILSSHFIRSEPVKILLCGNLSPSLILIISALHKHIIHHANGQQIQIPDVNADAEERDNYTLIQETPEDDLPGENGIAIRYSKDFNIVQANELLRSKQSDLTLMESKLIRLAVSQIMKGDKDLRT